MIPLNLPAYVADELVSRGLIPSHSFDEADEAPDLSNPPHSDEEDGFPVLVHQ